MNKCQNLIDLLELKGSLYHYKQLIKYSHRDDNYDGEVYLFMWSYEAQYLLRVLVGLTQYGTIDNAHINAIYYKKFN